VRNESVGRNRYCDCFHGGQGSGADGLCFVQVRENGGDGCFAFPAGVVFGAR